MLPNGLGDRGNDGGCSLGRCGAVRFAPGSSIGLLMGHRSFKMDIFYYRCRVEVMAVEVPWVEGVRVSSMLTFFGCFDQLFQSLLVGREVVASECRRRVPCGICG